MRVSGSSVSLLAFGLSGGLLEIGLPKCNSLIFVMALSLSSFSTCLKFSLNCLFLKSLLLEFLPLLIFSNSNRDRGFFSSRARSSSSVAPSGN